jgi:hypothetical protein
VVHLRMESYPIGRSFFGCHRVCIETAVLPTTAD